MADEKDKVAKAQERAQGRAPGQKGRRRRAPPRRLEPKAEAKPREPEDKVPARLRLRYEQEIRPTLMRELKIENGCACRGWTRS